MFPCRIALMILLGVAAGTASAQKATFRFQAVQPGVARIIESTMKIDMIMHEETETGAISDQSYASKRSDRRSALILDEQGSRVQLRFETFAIEDEDADPDELKAIETLLKKSYLLELTDSSATISLNGDTVTVLEENFVENEYFGFMMENAFARFLDGKQLAIGDSLLIPAEIVASLFQGMQFLDVEDEITLHLASIASSESGADEATFSFRTTVTRSDESAFVELVSTGTLVADISTGRPVSITNAGTVEIIATENPSANRGSGTIAGSKHFSYPAGYKP